MIMHDSLNISTPSPNAQHTAHLVAAGEIRFGPLYFSLSVGEHAFGDRIFGDAHLWSRSSRLLAVQEWLTTDYGEGPITTLVLIDLELRREATVARATKGFIVPETFAEPLIVYRKEYAGSVIEQFELDITTITTWRALA
jgi:hypothetical protein